MGCHGLSSIGADKSDQKSLSNDIGSLTDVVMYLYRLIVSFISFTVEENETLTLTIAISIL